MRISKFLAFLLLTSLVFLGVLSVSADQGNGTLYVYINLYTTEAKIEGPPPQTYSVTPGQIIWIQIANITEFDPGDLVQVKIGFEVDGSQYTYRFSDVPVHILGSGAGAGMIGVGDADHPIQWTVGDYNNPSPGGYIKIPYCNTMTVHYKNNTGTGPDYVANTLVAGVGHMHAVPVMPWGTIGVSSVFLIGIGVFVLKGKRKTANRTHSN